RVSDPNSKDPYRAGNVFEVPIAQIVESQTQALADMVTDRPRDADLSRVCQPFEPGRHIHAVAVNIAVLNDDVSEIDPHTENDCLFLGDTGIAFGHAALDRDRTRDCLDHARELD